MKETKRQRQGDNLHDSTETAVTVFETPPPLSSPVGAQAPRAPPSRRIADFSHAEYVPTVTAAAALRIEMHDEIFHFEIFKNLMKFLKYFKTPF